VTDTDVTATLHHLDSTAPPPCPTPTVLADIVADAATRARALLAGRHAPQDPIAHLVELLHNLDEKPAMDVIAHRAGLRTAQLQRLRTAFTFDGTVGVETAHLTHNADRTIMAAAAAEIERRLSTVPTAHIDRNHLTYPTAGIQLRLSTDGRWFAYTRTATDWAPVRGHSSDPTAAYRTALTAARSRHG
jgi:hypothetical protein